MGGSGDRKGADALLDLPLLPAGQPHGNRLGAARAFRLPLDILLDAEWKIGFYAVQIVQIKSVVCAGRIPAHYLTRMRLNSLVIYVDSIFLGPNTRIKTSRFCD
jgi:hypothetical protein